MIDHIIESLHEIERVEEEKMEEEEVILILKLNYFIAYSLEVCKVFN